MCRCNPKSSFLLRIQQRNSNNILSCTKQAKFENDLKSHTYILFTSCTSVGRPLYNILCGLVTVFVREGVDTILNVYL